MSFIKFISYSLFFVYSSINCFGQPNITAKIHNSLKDSLASNDYKSYADSIFQGHLKTLHSVIKKYDNDSCLHINYCIQDLKDELGSFKNLGDIDGDYKNDSVFVLNPLTWCEYDNGRSFYFTNSKLPRLISNSWCSNPKGFFKVADIDENGICEVGYFYTTCVSRYKSILIFRLRHNAWEQIASGEFDILTQEPSKIKLESLVKKISKNKFKVKNFYEGREYWEFFTIE